MRTTRIHDPIFRQEYRWVHATTSKQFSEYLKTRIPNYSKLVTEDHSGEACDGETIDFTINGKLVIYFWFNIEEPSAIIHELLHGVFRCMRSRGVILVEESEESFCYLLSFLYSTILKALKKSKKPK